MIILAWVSILLLACTILCGLWMKFGPGEKNAAFHGILSFAAVLTALVTIILFMVRMP